MKRTRGRPRWDYTDEMLTRIREIIVVYGYGSRRIKNMLEHEGFTNVPMYVTLHRQIKQIEQDLIDEGYVKVQLNYQRHVWVKQ